MARFRYSLQSILDIKMKMETQAKQEFSAAKNALEEENEKLAGLYQRKADYEEEAKKLLVGTLRVRDIEDNKNALLCMDEYIALQHHQVTLAERKLNEARERLTDVMKERKTHEALREKAFEEFLQEENKAEGKAVDELTSYTYGQKRQVEN
uniref:flagellar export protein FliJ n=1 Tax=Acetatifactor sp. TaxID=1872090 RepID=UPI0040571A3C